jgi:hypothetical protein
MVLSVEIEQDTLNPEHPMNMKAIQELSFNTEDKRETTRVTIKNPDNGTFRLYFMNPNTFKKEVSDEMKTNMSTG